MKINFNKPLKDLKGNDVINSQTKLPVMLNEIISDGLATDLSNKFSLQQFELAKKIAISKGEIEITSSEKTLLTECFNKDGKYTVLVAAQIFELIN